MNNKTHEKSGTLTIPINIIISRVQLLWEHESTTPPGWTPLEIIRQRKMIVVSGEDIVLTNFSYPHV